MRARWRSVAAVVVLASASPAAANVNVAVDTTADRHAISPLIYGINAVQSGTALKSLLAFTRPGLVRLGGNRWTAYNWENNASNAGAQFKFQNDGFLSSSATPGAAVLPTVRAATAVGAATMVTIPNVDYVAADRNADGDIRTSPNYTTTRLRQNRATGGPLTLTPDTGDAFVYQDQFVYWLAHSVPAGARVLFSLDNEPDLWSFTHPEVHPDAVTYAELGQRNAAFATMLKSVWAAAPVVGPASYGFAGYETLQNAADAGVDGNFHDWYLAHMATASQAAGHRILDDLDLHWYPEATGGGFRIIGTQTSPGVVAAREQAPRSLWDPGYVESSWITTYLGDKAIQLIPRIDRKIAAGYPGTGLSLSEWNYGGGQHISGAIATADVLGIFGRTGVQVSAFWPLGADESFAYAAFAMFRNFDGHGAAFGDTAVRATTSDATTTSAYASVDAAHPSRLVIVVINKATRPQRATIALKRGPDAARAHVVRLTGADPHPVRASDITASPRRAFRYVMPAQSVSVIVPEAVRLATFLELPSGAGCLRRLRVVVRSPGRVRSVRIKIGRWQARVARGKALDQAIVMALPKGRSAIRFTVTLKDGRTATGTKRLRRC